MSDRVSVVICAHDNWPDLELAIQSAVSQSHAPVEVIVVDNASTDATPSEVPRRFGDRVVYIRQENRGDGGAYNTGMRAATGDFIQLLDGDDLLAPDKIERQLAVFRADPEADLVYGNVRLFQTAAGAAAWSDVDVEAEAGVDLFLRTEGRGVGTVLGVLFRRRVVDRVGWCDEALYRSDADYLLRAAVAGCRYRFCAGVPLGFKRVRPGQMTANSAAMHDGTVALWEKARGYVREPGHVARVEGNLARARFLRALRRGGMTRRQVLAACREARATAPAAVPMSAYVAGLLTAFVPGGRAVAVSPLFRPVRRAAARLLGYQLH